jgi:hypothetical protein
MYLKKSGVDVYCSLLMSLSATTPYPDRTGVLAEETELLILIGKLGVPFVVCLEWTWGQLAYFSSCNPWSDEHVG